MAIKVLCTRKGYIQGRLIEPGETFEIGEEKEFSANWMEKVEQADEPVKTKGKGKAAPAAE